MLMIKCTFMPTFLNNEFTSHTIRCHLHIYIRLRVQEVTRVQSYGLSNLISDRDNKTQTTKNDKKGKIKKEKPEHKKITDSSSQENTNL